MLHIDRPRVALPGLGVVNVHRPQTGREVTTRRPPFHQFERVHRSVRDSLHPRASSPSCREDTRSGADWSLVHATESMRTDIDQIF